MITPLEEATSKILNLLAKQSRDKWLEAQDLASETGLSPEDINDAVTILSESGNVEWVRTLGGAPYNFRRVRLTARGRYEFERTARRKVEPEEHKFEMTLPPAPIGSPYGFHDEDWETVAARKASSNMLYVVLGYQFSSTHYDIHLLKNNVQSMFQQAVDAYNQVPGAEKVTLDFRALAAGYGEHLFNEIARDIIGADIAIFDTSELNPNVMLEMGVALTWGVRVLPIKEEGCPKPPSDISGQTWADYRNSGTEFVDPDHHSKLVHMVERAARKKGRGAV
jgi:DNA-binding Lrp family transcriptional regulator